MRRSSSAPGEVREPTPTFGAGLAGLRRRLLKGLAGHAFNQPLGIFIQLVSLPLLLGAWGVQLYGEWLILMAVPAYLVRSDIGFTTAAYNEMTMQAARGDRAGVLATFQTTWLIVSVSSLAAAVLVVAGVRYAPVGAWFQFSVLDPMVVAWVMAALALRVVFDVQTELLNGGFACAGAYGRGSFMLGLVRLVEFVLLVAAVVAGLGPIGAASGLALGRLVGVIMMAAGLRRVSGWLRHGVGAADRRTAGRLLRPGLGFCGMTLANLAKIQGMVLVVGAVLGPVAVVVYGTLRVLTRALEQILGTFHSTVQPEIAAAYGGGDMALVRRLHSGACRVALWLALGAAIVLAAAGGWFVTLWTDGAVAVPGPLFAALIAVMVLNSVWLATLLVLYGLNRTGRLAIVNLVIAAIGLGAAVPLGSILGLTGIGLAMLGVEAAMTVTIVHRTLGFLGTPAAAFARALARPPVDILRQARTAAHS